jgi:hypothetical protein
MHNMYDMSADEWMERLADALETSRASVHRTCTEEGCENPIRRSIRCESCRKKRHAAAERARMARRKSAA